jgi:peptidyl-prolyl cis-trans isomerase SurA
MKFCMRHRVGCVLITAMVGAMATGLALAAPAPIDRVVAVVDNTIVLESDLNERLADITARAQGQKMALPDSATLKNQVLEHLIVEQLQVQTAKRYGVTIDDAQIQAAMSNMLQESRLTEAQFIAELAKEGLTPALLKARIERDLLVQNIQRGLVSQRIAVSELEIDNFLKSAEAQFWLSPEYHLGHILIPVSQNADEAAVKAALDQVNALYARATQGAVFAELAIAYSKSPDALKGGDLGFRKSSDLPTLFAEIVPTLALQQVSAPFRSAAGFHLLKLYEKKGQTQQIVQQTKARHILVKTSAILNDADAEKKLAKIRADILAGEDFTTLAKAHSEDIGSMLSGGDLGWANPGQFVPEFEKVLASAAIGEVSQPFKSQFGWHILQVQERRAEDMTEAAIRNKARNIITNRRFEDELQVWLRELRDEAYVDIKPL